MRKLNYLPILMLSTTALAESPAPVVDVAASGTQAVTAVATDSVVTQDNVLPQLSFAAQQARAEALAKQAENIIQREEEKRIAAEKLAQAEARLQQEIGTYQLLLSSTVAQVYLENDFQPLWSDKNAEKIFLKEYAAFAISGVSTKSAKALQQIINMPEGLAKDILLTDSFLDYLYYNKNVVKFANQWLYNLGSYSTSAPAENHISAWVQATKSGSMAQYIANLVPRNHIYQETIQKLFATSSNGSIGNSAKKKSKKVNNEQNVEVGLSTSFYKLALNAQRLRLIPSFNNGIFVNIPSYQLHYFRDGKAVLQSKVIVGRDERRTPVMYSKLSNVVVNPPWNVPASIKNKDLVPKMRQDPSYVERKGYEIIDSKGSIVNPYSINWAAYDNPTKNFPYHIRQKAGDDSALGRYKFNMPSSDAIYLHDTPNHGLFGKSDRALSSGCVRVAKSDELATLLLKEAGWSEERKRNVLASNKTTSAPIRSDNPVYLYYVTSWVEGGKVYTLPDIYKYDVKIPKTSLDWAKVKNLI
ncbi:L,D-transpeptidase family protein [Ursidibacter maritimus]|uniref:L,D-transpeptidase family protein n=1 Tax=Ursidibacter maritimus TaxID=1331689 RepID=A0A949SYK5_9PAST|nr:L,D-transpeptidase family protein [Ursidibacter maritimus]KAE9540392.1 L,D-transpeptidase [Ursidibacter maritimus]MBV6524978.1 L,D-transpeptidase family protein [Ursidibacter maritimus]MBV6527180.1 L,D-transpeptidase family protein [Ursidibacter maritimus]MBV6529892.1 L,D-transpeptidase family protein [Ursidibacter maritimus]MBV6530785.1 L,D-transpeptidase family protein [Ursidibacter maritimus]